MDSRVDRNSQAFSLCILSESFGTVLEYSDTSVSIQNWFSPAMMHLACVQETGQGTGFAG
jgi:hypothetical protein